MNENFPDNAIAAVMHRDPYPYYAQLVERSPFCKDPSIGLWVAASAAAVRNTLTCPVARVRPAAEPVPAFLIGTAAGKIFGNLIRMNDGAGHCPFRDAVASTLASINSETLVNRSFDWAQVLLRERDILKDVGAINEFAFALAPHVVGDLLGLPHTMLMSTSQWTGDFVRCVFPGSSAEEIERGKDSAGRLFDLFSTQLELGRSGLLTRLAEEAARIDARVHDVIVANGIGFLSQAYEATAGLIGNTLLALAHRPRERERAASDAAFLQDFIQEVLRFDPPGQNTRRFVEAETEIAGATLARGDVVLVVWAAANRDPKLNALPDQFVVERRNRKLLTFGFGVHACPGESVAATIAAAGIQALMAARVDFESLSAGLTYRRSANTRIPLFGTAKH